jgi:two-component system, cell cycle sensor histidine kinase and response regulator CckA
VLVAEDEDALRTIVVRTVKQLGLEGLDARTAEEVPALARARSQPLDLLVADLVVLAMSGKELADELLRDHPDLKILLMTGFPSDPQVVEALHNGGQVLQPFRRSTLVERLRALVAEA